MDKLHKLILVSMSIMIVLIIIITLLIMYLKRSEEYNKDNHVYQYIEEIEVGTTLEPVTVRNAFYAVKNCISKFYTYNNLIKDESEENIQAIYKMLDPEYIKYRNITTDNLATKILPIDDVSIRVTDMYVTEKNPNVSIYIAHGNLVNNLTTELQKFSMMLKVDMTNQTYKIFLEDYLNEKYSDLKIGDNINIECEEEIKDDTYNTFKFQAISDEKYIKDIFKDFQNDILNNKSGVYEKLDGEYKSKKFTSLNAFENYIKTLKNQISVAKLSKYKAIEYENYTQYICIDNYDNTYIFNETAPMKYDIILDAYTIDIPEFVEDYNTSNVQTKVQTNIKKFFTSINDKDYNYAYSVLADSFKQNKYQNTEIFKKYIEQNLYERNTIEFKEFSEQGSNYMYKIKVINQNQTENVYMTIIMKLHEGTKFEMSFSID